MIEIYKAARALVTDRKGVTALEYGLIASLIAVAIVVVIRFSPERRGELLKAH